MRKLFALLQKINWKRLLTQLAVFLVFFVAFIYWTFPWDTVRANIISRVESKQLVSVEIQKLKPFRGAGLRLDGVVLRSAKNPEKILANLEEVRVRLRPLKLLGRQLWLDFDAYAYDGGLAGSFCWRQGLVDLAVNFVDLGLDKYNMQRLAEDLGSVHMKGNISGNAELHLNRKDKGKSSGEVNLNFNSLQMVNLNLVQHQLPDIAFEPGKLAFELKNKVFRIKDFDLKSNHLELKLSGSMYLNDQDFRSSRPRFSLKFKPSEEMIKALEDYYSLLVMRYPPDRDDFLEFKIQGQLNDLKAGSQN